MEDQKKPEFGIAGWIDLTVENAEQLRDFYAKAIGWKTQEISMGDYADYAMVNAETGQGVTGICHHRGTNVGIPPVWIVYFTVPDLDASLAAVRELGGELVIGPKSMGPARYAMIRDPAGAVCGLYQP